MFALFEGPGGPFRRLAGEVVPLLVGFAAGWMAWPFLGWGGAVVGLLVALAVSYVLVRVRRRPVLRAIWRVALLLHVAFWSWRGVEEGELRPAGPVERGAAGALWSPARPFRAGFGDAPFEFAEAPLAGYGSRARRKAMPAFGGFGLLGRACLAAMDPGVPMLAHAERGESRLGARALVLIPEGGEPGPSLAIVRLDLVVVDDGLHGEMLQELLPGTRPWELLLCASHTHSGPGGFHHAPLAQVIGTDHEDPRMRAAVRAAALRAIQQAVTAARPARMAVHSAHDRDEDGRPILARNRHKADPDEIDDYVLALRFEDREDGRALGLLLNYAVHPTVLGQSHLAFSRDLVGAVEDALSARLRDRPPVLFVQGALGDVGPRRYDAEPLRDIVPMAVRFAARIASRLDVAGGVDRVQVRSAWVTRDLGSPHTFGALGSRRAFGEDVAPSPVGRDLPTGAANLLSLPVNVLPWSLGLSEMRVGFTFRGAAGGTVNLDRAVGTRTRAFGALVLESEDGTLRLPILWLPGEATQSLGKRWRAAVEAKGLPTPMIFGLTNGSMAYIASPEEHDEQHSYEAVVTLYGRDTATRVEECLFAALDAALSSSAGR